MSEHHNAPTLGVYLAVFATLLVLTAVTVWVAFQDYGFLNNVIAVGIACIKALVVILYFMHVRYASRLTWLFAGVGFVFVMILFAFALSDFLSRGWLGMAPSGYLSIQ